MKLWLISQNEENGYDTYDSAVVAAETELEAKRTHPSDYHVYSEEFNDWGFQMSDGRVERQRYHSGDWCRRYQDVRCEYLGEAREGHPAGVICSSFNAG